MRKRRSVIQSNPAYQNSATESSAATSHSGEGAFSNDEEELLSEGADSESSEYIDVDAVEPAEPTNRKTAAQRLQCLLSRKEHILRRWQIDSHNKHSPEKRESKIFLLFFNSLFSRIMRSNCFILFSIKQFIFEPETIKNKFGLSPWRV